MCEMCNDENNIELPEFLNKVGSKYVIKKTVNELEEYTELIKRSIANLNKNFLEIGRLLKEVHDKEVWKKKSDELNLLSPSYSSFEFYCQANFDMSRSSAYKFISVYSFYSKFADIGTLQVDKYSFSQLQEMCSIQDEDSELLNQIEPVYSIQTIRRLKHEYYKSKNKKESSNQEPQVKSLKQILSEPIISNKEIKQALHNDYDQALNIVESDAIEPLVLKNKDERLKFLDSYRSWELLAVVAYLGLKIYRRRLKNKASIIVMVAENIKNPTANPDVKYTVFAEPDYNSSLVHCYSTIAKFNLWFETENQVVDYLTQHKKEIE